MAGVTVAGDFPVGDGVLADVPPSDLEAEIAELRRQARRQSSELAALLGRLDDLQGQISRHQQYWTPVAD